jgi:hypothetical protein
MPCVYLPGPAPAVTVANMNPPVSRQIRRGVGVQDGGARSLLHMGQAGYISAAH